MDDKIFIIHMCFSMHCLILRRKNDIVVYDIIRSSDFIAHSNKHFVFKQSTAQKNKNKSDGTLSTYRAMKKN